MQQVIDFATARPQLVKHPAAHFGQWGFPKPGGWMHSGIQASCLALFACIEDDLIELLGDSTPP